jgi:hypothetical protein
MGLPFVAEQAYVGVDVAVLGWVSGAWTVGAVLGEGAGGVLGPETVEDEGKVLGALGRGGVGGAELRRPGEVEEVVIERLGGGWLEGKCCSTGTRDGLGCGLGVRVTGRKREKKAEEDDNGSLLHGGSSISGYLRNWLRQRLS